MFLAAQFLAHGEVDRTLLRDLERIVRIDGVKTGAVILGQVVDVFDMIGDDLFESGIFFQYRFIIGAAEIAEGLPILVEVLLADECLLGTLEQNRFDLSDHRLTTVQHNNFLLL